MAAFILAALALSLSWALYGPAMFENAEAQGENCTEVFTLGPETESQITPPINIDGNSFRVSGILTNTEGGDGPTSQSLTITPTNQEDDFPTDIILVQEEGPFDDTVLEGPGTFTLEIDVGVSGNVEYTLLVEDCGATPGGGPAPERTTPQPSPGPGPSPSPTPPPRPQPAPQPPPTPPLMKAGGPEDGPAPKMPSGECPKEYPVEKGKGCYR